MRTTVDLDDDLLNRLRREAHRSRVPFKQLLNRVLRRGLDDRAGAPPVPYECPAFSTEWQPRALLKSCERLRNSIETAGVSTAALRIGIGFLRRAFYHQAF